MKDGGSFISSIFSAGSGSEYDQIASGIAAAGAGTYVVGNLGAYFYDQMAKTSPLQQQAKEAQAEATSLRSDADAAADRAEAADRAAPPAADEEALDGLDPDDASDRWSVEAVEDPGAAATEARAEARAAEGEAARLKKLAANELDKGWLDRIFKDVWILDMGFATGIGLSFLNGVGTPNKGDSFTEANTDYSDAIQFLALAEPDEDQWQGEGATAYATATQQVSTLTEQLQGLDQQLQELIATNARANQNCRDTVNICNAVMLAAMPIANWIYCNPALGRWVSRGFQMATVLACLTTITFYLSELARKTAPDNANDLPDLGSDYSSIITAAQSISSTPASYTPSPNAASQSSPSPRSNQASEAFGAADQTAGAGTGASGNPALDAPAAYPGLGTAPVLPPPLNGPLSAESAEPIAATGATGPAANLANGGKVSSASTATQSVEPESGTGVGVPPALKPSPQSAATEAPPIATVRGGSAVGASAGAGSGFASAAAAAGGTGGLGAAPVGLATTKNTANAQDGDDAGSAGAELQQPGVDDETNSQISR